MTYQPTEFNPTERGESDFAASQGIASRVASKVLQSIVPLAVPGYVEFIDRSRYNTVDIKAMWNAGYRVIGLKATEGVSWVDPTFEPSWNEALECGFLIIAYHFFRSNLSGVAQAEWHLEKTRRMEEQGKGHILSNQVDVETNDSTTQANRRVRVLECLKKIDEGTGRIPGCYSSPYLWGQLMGTVNWISLYRNWIASWTSAAAPTMPPGWTKESTWYWQRGIAGKHSWLPSSVPGCTGQIDYNASFKTLAELQASAGVVEAQPVDKVQAMWEYGVDQGWWR